MSIVSVVVPAYNTELFIRSCIESVLANDDVELILVDDGSTDNTLSIMKEYEDRENVTVIRMEHAGLGAARNKGISEASGDHIWFVDSDDVIDRGSISRIITKGEETGADVMCLDIVPFADNASLNGKLPHYRKLYKRKKRYEGVYTGPELMETLVSGGDLVPTSARYVVRRDFIENNGIRVMEGVFHEDNSWTFEVLLKAERATYIMEPLYRRRLREGSIVTTPLSAEKIRGYILNIIKMRETADGFFGADHIPSYVNEAIGKTIRSMYLACRKLSSEEEKRLGEMTPEEREAFNGIMADLEESERIIRALNSEKADLKSDNEKLRKEREEIVSSLSYKIGRGITFVPRRIGALAKKWKS